MSSTIKVLLVDDEKQFRTTTEKILVRRGFEAILAGSGEEAVAKLVENPDVVILDIRMPGMDGLQALKAIREKAPHLPVIMLTGHSSEPLAEEALTKGAFDFLNKPCDIDLLSAKINEAVRSGHEDHRAAENGVREIMIPVAEYTSVPWDTPLKEAIGRLHESFITKAATDSIMETGHRSIMVMNKIGQVLGILSIVDLIQAIMPSYLHAPKPFMADSIQYSPMFWGGMFTRAVKELAGVKINEIMSPAPPSIRAEASLMEAAYTLQQTGARRLVVMADEKVVGVLREQDLFFEMARILSGD